MFCIVFTSPVGLDAHNVKALHETRHKIRFIPTLFDMPESVGRHACNDVLTGCVVGCLFCRGGAEALACMTCVGDANAAGSGVATTRVGERTEYVGMAVGLKVLDGVGVTMSNLDTA